ncbi:MULTISPECIES: hypothetical protein [Pseudofrankia]|uniref:hypothetical protein n=1 Tax=Pseudofrankia TaxID=2994363 RepID=UPI0002F9F11F|nr:hypothetical protein BCD49_36430 [Pseudofrankia sp. EUN1h]
MIKGAADAPGAPGGLGCSSAKQLAARYVELLALQLAPHSFRLGAIHPTNGNPRCCRTTMSTERFGRT